MKHLYYVGKCKRRVLPACNYLWPGEEEDLCKRLLLYCGGGARGEKHDEVDIDNHDFIAQCVEKTVENTVETPVETCNMEPVEECKNVTIRLVESESTLFW